ncbi:ATP-binding protein [Paenibacillus rigui]|uniref:histidine kinase n=1 Tax=Paenibacillus rigui TaxID=554312 RepID=A0A229UJ12_9BACL|nr:ATP-binding protein [Paenibacillus rigui]OXM83370.1 hypothetical protein CF651_26095 [Paenibacillus rigui]
MDHLLLNVLIIWACIFLYQVLWVDGMKEEGRQNRAVMASLLFIGIVACLWFPINVFPAYSFDLHGVLLIMGYLYGGFIVGVVLSALVLFVQLAHFTQKLALVLVHLVFIHMLMLLTLRRYMFFAIGKKLLAAMLIATSSAALLALAMYALFRRERLGIHPAELLDTAGYCLFYGLLTALSVYFMEKIRANRARRIEIKQREKLQLLGEIAAAVAHEIRNPMTVARGFLQLMKGNEAAASRFQEFVPMIMEEMDRAEAVLHDYLTLAKPFERQAEVLDLKEQLTHVVTILSPYAALYEVEIHSNWQIPQLQIHFDRKQWRLVLIHLIKNGIEAMSQGGKLDVELYREGEHAVIRIRDRGVGMHEEELKRLGSLFYSTKAKGTGRGLMICYKIIEDAQGTIHVESVKGKGTLVTLRLPLFLDKLKNGGYI